MSQAPQDLERTDEQPKSQYISKKDIKVFLIALILLAVLLSPVYFVLKENSDSYLCKRNMQAISKAIMLYAAENNDRLPPAYVTMDGVTPYVERDGGVYTWANLIHPHMKRDTSLKCPKASEEDCFLDHDSGTGKLMHVSYGMYLPMGGMAISSISNPESSILVGETSSSTTIDAFNPFPIKGPEGQRLRDGFIITWNTGNRLGSEAISAVSRLAYPNTASGQFKKDGAARHPGGNHFITVAGTSVTLPPTAAIVDWDPRRKVIQGKWTVPEPYLLGSN